jgi:serine protease AprX
VISTVRRPIGLVAATVVFAATAAAALPASGSTGAAPSVGAPLVRAVVSVADSAGPVVADGVRLLAVFPRVGAELVSATPAALQRLAADPRVLGIAPDDRVTTAGNTWGGAQGVLAASTLGEPAGKPGAGRGVTVALLDTGVADTPALNRASGRLVDGVDVSRLDGLSTCTTPEFTDGYGHGTFLASLIAGGKVPGSGNRGIGVAPGARVVNVKVADCNGETRLSEVLAGMDWVAAHAHWIQVLNIALSVVRPTYPAYGADPLTVGVEHVRDAGVLVVAAAGNTAGQVGDPGMDYKALTVGAADVTGAHPAVASFSGSGLVAGVSKPDLVAPGVKVLGVMPADTAIALAHQDGRQPNGLFRGSGTSEATAIASGAAALYLSRHHHASPRGVKAALRQAALPLGDSAAGAGLLRVPRHAAGDGVEDGSLGTPSGGTDWSNEASFDAASWSASSWSASSWSASSWSQWLASSWSASSWSASSWSASSWSASSWSASSWSASSWSASSWSASSWSASSWSASSWSASSWSASSWSASSWSASSWSAAGWGEDA